MFDSSSDTNSSSYFFDNYVATNLTQDDDWADVLQHANKTTLECPTHSKEDTEMLHQLTFWVDGVATCIMAFIGLIANIVSALILGKEDMRNSFNFLLIALICMDSCYLVASILESFRRGLQLTTVAHIFLFPYFFYPLLSIAVTGSIFMTVAIAFERYIAVHYPIDYSQAINSPEACKKRLLKYVVPVVFISTIFNIPKFFESHVQTSIEPILGDGFSLDDNGTLYYDDIQLQKDLLTPEDWYRVTAQNGFTFDDIVYEETHSISITEMRKDPAYIIYYQNWTRLVVMGLLPTLLLIYFNYKIYKDVKHRNRRQLSMSRTSATATQQARRKQEDNLAIVFMGIVLVFLVCHTPRNLLSLAEMAMVHNSIACNKNRQHGFPIWVLVTTSISHTLLVVNSSTNMILYIFLNKLFRVHFLNLVKTVFGFAFGSCRKAANNNEAQAVTANAAAAADGGIPLEPLMNGQTTGGNGAALTAVSNDQQAKATTAAVTPMVIVNEKASNGGGGKSTTDNGQIPSTTTGADNSTIIHHQAKQTQVKAVSPTKVQLEVASQKSGSPGENSTKTVSTLNQSPIIGTVVKTDTNGHGTNV